MEKPCSCLFVSNQPNLSRCLRLICFVYSSEIKIHFEQFRKVVSENEKITEVLLFIKYIAVTMAKYIPVTMAKYIAVTMAKYIAVTMAKYIAVTMAKYIAVTMVKLDLLM